MFGLAGFKSFWKAAFKNMVDVSLTELGLEIPCSCIFVLFLIWLVELSNLFLGAFSFGIYILIMIWYDCHSVKCKITY